MRFTCVQWLSKSVNSWVLSQWPIQYDPGSDQFGTFRVSAGGVQYFPLSHTVRVAFTFLHKFTFDDKFTCKFGAQSWTKPGTNRYRWFMIAMFAWILGFCTRTYHHCMHCTLHTELLVQFAFLFNIQRWFMREKMHILKSIFVLHLV